MPKDVLEPTAIAAGEMMPNASMVEVTTLSLAISAKRIADALSGIGPNILTAPLNAYGENIGECIQGQFGRSGR